MNKILLLILLSVPALSNCQRQTAPKALKISGFKFQSIFGSTNNDSENVYCLLGTGFFRTRHSANSDSLITAWIKLHADASVVPVCSYGPIDVKYKDSKMTYCWVIDRKDTLNNDLIKNGCFPGSTMMRPKTRDEMGERERKLYKGSDEGTDIKVLIDTKSYDNFIQQIIVAEAYARAHKLGIWLKEAGE